ncbi:MAG: histidinol-phosphatase HisJ family protein [Lachnospiraceae bacterium]|nr:histidinol-phosphatase HisJ family protein [Lachnospiraceae bacterium]
MLCDFHMHSSFSEDSDTPMEAMVLQSIRLGLQRICFTEHMDMDYPEQYGTFQVDLPSYYEEVKRLQKIHQGRIEILFGIELGMQPHLAEPYSSIIKQYPFDFIIASQHLLGGDDPYQPCFWKGRDEADTYRSYFEELLSNLKQMEDYDTLGHLDYVVRYGPNQNRDYSYEAFAESIDAILTYLIEQGKYLEVNSAGLKYGLSHPNPEESVLRRYLELGGTNITIGADGHRPEHIAYDFPLLEKLLTGLGFTGYTIFRRRQPVFVPFKSRSITV